MVGLRFTSRFAVPAVLAVLAACAVGPNFKRPAPPPDTSYGAAPSQGTTASVEAGSAGSSSAGSSGVAQRFVSGEELPGEWWIVFRSQQLSDLVAETLRANPNMTAAHAALREAQHLYVAQRATLFPSVQAGFEGTRSKLASATLTPPTVATSNIYNLYTAQLSLSYTLDVFGGVRRQLELAGTQVDTARYQLIATDLTLSSNAVVIAITEASLRGQITATERILALQHQLTETARARRKLGTFSDVDLLPQEAAEAQTAATLPPLRKQLRQTRDALTALLGRLPAEEPATTFHLEDLTLPDDLPVSIPSRLVAQRPDVLLAEANLHAASAQVGISIANMLPQFQISADTGSAALAMSQLFKPYTDFWDLGASLTQTLFNAGALVYRHKAANDALDVAGAEYRAAVIVACQNVADTLHALQADADALKASSEAQRAAKAAFELAQKQQKLGTISMVALLNAEQTYLQAEIALVQAQANRYADTAGLFQALGGGWWNRPEGTFK
jgi:NodT family efflux transporter outer membrane factor (OMF) lipoprotein